jgi:hypothetical protein
VWSVQDHFLAPAKLKRADDVLVFCIENQGVVRWGIPLASVSDDDPPVLVSDPDDVDGAWLVEAETTTAFALQFAALNAKFSRSVENAANGQVTDAAIELVERGFARLPFGDIHWPSFPTRLYAGPDVLVEIDGLTWVWVSARSASALEPVANAMRSVGVVFERCTLDE